MPRKGSNVSQRRQISPILQVLAGEGMAKTVRIDRTLHASLLLEPPQDLPDTLSRESPIPI